MRGGGLKRFKIATPSVVQRGGTLWRFQQPFSTPPFNGTWKQIGAQRGAGLGDVFREFKKGAGESVKKAVRTRSLSNLKQGVKRSASKAIGNELQRVAKRKLNDIFGT